MGHLPILPFATTMCYFLSMLYAFQILGMSRAAQLGQRWDWNQGTFSHAEQ